MIIVYSKDGQTPRTLTTSLALQFYRAFRAELWLTGTRRDPETGDELLGMKILSLTL
jgi:hypothetical protein